jgi:hypothetical protein
MGSGNQGYGIFQQDRTTGLDGHAQRNANTYNLDISNNTLTNAYYAITCASSGASAGYLQKHITIRGNKFYNCTKSPIRIGPGGSGLTMDVQYIHVMGNVIHSWSGNIEGAISFYGDTGDPTKMKNIFIEDNYVADNTTGAASGAIRLSAAMAELIRNNYLSSTGSYGAISTPNSGVVNKKYNNVGVGASGSANQVLGIDSVNGRPEYKSIAAGAGISVSHSAGDRDCC